MYEWGAMQRVSVGLLVAAALWVLAYWAVQP